VKLVFFGSGAFGLASLRALLDAGLATALVVSQPPRRRRRGKPPEPTPVHAHAQAAGIEVITPAKANAQESLARLRAANADLFVVAEYGQILSQELLDIPSHGAVNVHASLLPRHRGASPVAAAILAGDEETGVTIQRVVQRLDAGPVLAERRMRIEPRETAGALSARLAPLGGELVVEVVRAFAAGSPPSARPQDEERVTVCRRLSSADAVVDWSHPAERIERHVRAMTPKPGARTELVRDPPLLVVLREVRVAEGEGDPGVVVTAADGELLVGTGAGLLAILELVPAARKPMRARDFLNGYQLSAGGRFR